MQPDQPTPKRKRFQFSLRTLVIVVLVYGGLWLLTIKMGGQALARAYAEFYRPEQVTFTNNDEVMMDIKPAFEFTHWVSPKALRGVVHSPLPFVLMWEWESIDAADKNIYRPISNRPALYYFYFPGKRITITNRPPQFQHSSGPY